MSNPIPFPPPKSEARSPSAEVDKGRVVRGAANCSCWHDIVGAWRGKAARRIAREGGQTGGKKDGGKMAREDWGHRKDQAESDHHRSGRRGCASTAIPEADRQRRQVGSREGRIRAGSLGRDWTASGGSVRPRRHGEGEKWDSGASDSHRGDGGKGKWCTDRRQDK